MSKAIEEIRAAAYLDYGQLAVNLRDAERIITAQEQLIEKLKADHAVVSKANRELQASRTNLGNQLNNAEDKIEAQEQRLDWTRQERDKNELMSLKLCDERDALLEKVEQQEQRIGELETEIAVIKLKQVAEGMCHECAGTGLKSYHAMRMTDACDVCQGSGGSK